MSASLIAHGFNPHKVYKMLDEYINMRFSEEETMSRYGIRQTREAKANLDLAFEIMDSLERENHIVTDKRGRQRTGLN